MTIQRTVGQVEPTAKNSMLVVSNWTFTDPFRNAHGLSFSQITNGDAPVVYSFEGANHFDASTHTLGGERTTPGIQMQLSKLAESELDCVIACVQQEVIENAEKYGVTSIIARDRFKSPLSKKDKFPANFRVKINGTRYWKDGNPTTAPESHAGKKWQAKVHLKSLWFSKDAWGISCVATDLQEICENVICPFEK